MYSNRLKMFAGLALAAAAIISVPSNLFAAPAAITSTAATVSLSATLPESITLSTGAVSSVSFSLTNGQTSVGGAAVPITTTWVLNPARTSVKVYGWVSSSTAALTDGGGNNIAAANVLGQVTTGAPTTYTAFTQTNSGFGSASTGLLLVNQAISSGSSNFVGNRTDNLSLEINTPATLPAGSYTGTLTLQAQAN